MNIINSNFTTSYTKIEQYSTNKNKDTSASKNIEISTLDIEYQQGYDLTNITPKDTIKLAVNLLESEQIDLYDFVGLSSIAFSKEYPPNTINYYSDSANNEPFNLLDELEKISSGTHETFTFGTESDRKDTKDLLDFLFSIPKESLKIEQTSIEVYV